MNDDSTNQLKQGKTILRWIRLEAIYNLFLASQVLHIKPFNTSTMNKSQKVFEINYPNEFFIESQNAEKIDVSSSK